jgi:hypothetical protein
MTTHQPSPDSSCAQPTHRGHARPTSRRRTHCHGIVACGHRTAAALIKFDGTRLGVPRGERGSTA